MAEQIEAQLKSKQEYNMIVDRKEAGRIARKKQLVEQ